MKQVEIYTDGGCIGNPGPGGYGVVLLSGTQRKEISGGYKHTTNNRMELMACTIGLEALKYQCEVTLYSDSKYVVNGISKGWAKKWQANNWMLNKKKRALNTDLWKRLLRVTDKHKVQFKWVKGHSQITENERCDQLANGAAKGNDLKEDKEYVDFVSVDSESLF